jgi:hypothetical protein
MKILEDSTFNFSIEQDPIKTERSVYEFFSANECLEYDYDYAAVPIAYLINKKGLVFTQNIINKINEQTKNKKIFVCQHIYVKKLNFHGNIVFTPHCLNSDDLNVIPHFNHIYSERPSSQERFILCSFIGCPKTHQSRFLLQKYESKDIIIDYNSIWFFMYGSKSRQKIQEKYQQALEKSYFSFCPRGTGESTLRLYEAISAGSFPIVFNDVKIPESLEKFVIRKDIREEINFDEIKNTHSEEMRQEMMSIYWSEYSNENIYKCILRKIS